MLIDQPEHDETGRVVPDVFVGRTFADAPSIDPVVIVTSQTAGQVAPGQIVPCEIVMTDSVDLIAVPA